MACAIPDPESGEVVITGGVHTGARVSVYTEAGWRGDLAPLRGERWRHGCTSYRDRGTRVITVYRLNHSALHINNVFIVLQILIVTGGSRGLNEHLDSTEIFKDNVWRTGAGKLPAPMFYMRATVISNRVLLFGKTISDRI